jgi:glycosyltransferase involved in cell wall biosynthesis
VVLSTLFPSAQEPLAGLFIRERMFRVARLLPVTVVAPQAWFPFQGLLRRWRPGYRPTKSRHEWMDNVEVFRPRFLSLPGVMRRWDGFFMALGALHCLRRLARAGRLDVIDAHFGYPDGYAASLLARWLRLPFTVTLRGTEPRHAADPALRPRLAAALRGANRVFAVSGSLRQVAHSLGVPPERTAVVGNGVDLERFAPLTREEARQRLAIPSDAQVLISVGALVERKGFHRVIDALPALIERFPRLQYLVVGGASPEGDIGERLRAQAAAAGLQDVVRFFGPLQPDALRVPLSAADVFVLATSNEGWANVFLEAMACGLPIVTTRVGGNAEVVSDPELGMLVPSGDRDALVDALAEALRHRWDRDRIRRHAEANGWERRVEDLVAQFRALATAASPASGTQVALPT